MSNKKGRIVFNGIPTDVVELVGRDGRKNWKLQLAKTDPEKLPTKFVILGHTKEGVGLDHGDLQKYNKEENKIEQGSKKFTKVVKAIHINQITNYSTSFPFTGTAVVGASWYSGTSVVTQKSNILTLCVGTHASGTLVVGKDDERLL